MTKSSVLFLTAAAVVVLAISIFSLSPASPDGPTRRKAVVVELFTSEGCSSCPPADELLGHLRGAPAGGAEVIPLGFHVDYWNYLGWRDRFSSSAFSSRQETYAARFRLGGPYTPQMVVDGSQEFTGGSGRRAQEAIARAATQSEEAEVQLALSAAGKLSVRVKGLVPGAAGDVMLAVTEDNLSSNVGGGENSGHVLRHSAVVREFRLLGQLKDGHFETEATVTPDEDWKLNDLRVVVFVQASAHGKIEGAASLPWTSGSGNR